LTQAVSDWRPVGASSAGRIVALRPPVLRLRYRHGVYVTLSGYPDWIPYAAAVVRIAPTAAVYTVDEDRLLHVLAANEVLARHTGNGAPHGWIWARLGNAAESAADDASYLALVPAELHGAFRHRGGGAGARSSVPLRGLLADDLGGPVPFRPARTVTAEAIEKLESWLGYGLPDAYRTFLAATNGGVPWAPGVLRTSGILVDQPLFGLAATDRMQDLAYANMWLRDRLTADFLGIGYVQGGLLALRVRGDRAGSIWHWDDDDPRDDERYEAPVICRDLLRPCAPDMTAFLAALSPVPASLRAVATGLTDTGSAALVAVDGLGAALPRSRRPFG